MERWLPPRGPRVLPHAAFVLGAPGTSVVWREGGVVIGHRPGAFQVGVAAGMVAAGLGAGWLFAQAEPWLGVGIATFFALPSLGLLNAQRWDIERGEMRLRGRALGFAVERALGLQADARVRVDTRFDPTTPDMPDHQVQLLTEAGWVGVAEAGVPGPAEAFAQRLADTLGLPLDGSAPAPSVVPPVGSLA